MVKNLPVNAGDAGLIPGLGRSPGGGNGNPLQCSCLENPMDRGVWQAMVHGVKKSRTGLNMHTHYINLKKKCSSQILFLSLVLLSTLTVSKVTEPVFHIHSRVGMPLYARTESLLSPLSLTSMIKEENPPIFTLLWIKFVWQWIVGVKDKSPACWAQQN